MANLVRTTTKPSEADMWATSWKCFSDAQFLYGRDFEFDVCAESHTTKCEKFFTEEEDALAKDWPEHWWCNPPFSNKLAFIRKAREQQGNGKQGVMLLPYEPLTKWWRDNLTNDVIIYEPDGRYNFLERDGITEKHGVNFGCVFVMFPAFKLAGQVLNVRFNRGISNL